VTADAADEKRHHLCRVHPEDLEAVADGRELAGWSPAGLVGNYARAEALLAIASVCGW